MTPSTVDNFSRFFAELFEDKSLITVAKGFQGMFGRAETGGRTIMTDQLVVDIDIKRGNKKIAALIPRGTVSRSIGTTQRNLSTEKFSTFSRKFPLAEEEGDITAEVLNASVAGESPYDARAKLSRLRSRGVDIVMENIRRIGDMFEVLAAQSILTGKMDSIIGTSDTELQYDFRRKSDHTVSISDKWDGGSAAIIDDIESACDKVKTDGRIRPDILCLGGEAHSAFINDTDVQAQADNRRFELIQVSLNFPVPANLTYMVTAGWTAYGRLRTPKGYELWIFVNQDYYENNAGTVVDYMPQDQALIMGSQARLDRYFGPGETLPMIGAKRQLYSDMFGISPESPPAPMGTFDNGIIRPDMFYHDAYVSGDWKKVTMRTQAAPIFATNHTDAFVTLTDLLTT